MTEKKTPEGIHPSGTQDGVERQQVTETRESRLSDEQLLAELSDKLDYLVNLSYDAKAREEHIRGTNLSESTIKESHRKELDKITAEILKRLQKTRKEK